MEMALLKNFNISTGKDMFYCLTYNGKVMGRFRTYKQATAHKLSLLSTMSRDGNCVIKQPRGVQ